LAEVALAGAREQQLTAMASKQAKERTLAFIKWQLNKKSVAI